MLVISLTFMCLPEYEGTRSEERRSDFWPKGTERADCKGTERGKERRSEF